MVPMRFTAIVCFRNGEPSKQDYRKFNIKTVQGINDFASMEEVVSGDINALMDDQNGCQIWSS